MARKAFFSFHYEPDNWRAATVRSIGALEGNEPAKDNDWTTVTKGGDAAIEKWIAAQMNGRTCTIVLVGAKTANRKWINHEIVRSWSGGLGLVGIRIHGLKDAQQQTSVAGDNPFDYVTHRPTNKPLSSIVKLYQPGGATSQERYAWIKEHLANAVEEAIKIRASNL